MKTIPRSLAALELLLVFPAVLFMTSLVARSIQPRQYEPAHTAQRIVDWYASSPHVGLWILLIALPLAVLVIGSATLLREWRRNQALRTATLEAIGIIRAHAIRIADCRCHCDSRRNPRHRRRAHDDRLTQCERLQVIEYSCEEKNANVARNPIIFACLWSDNRSWQM